MIDNYLNAFVDKLFSPTIIILLNNIKKSKMHTDNSYEWIEDAISRKHIKYYEYQHFSNFQEIGFGRYGKAHRANWKNTHKYFALKSFYNFNNITVKEIVHEVVIMIYPIYSTMYAHTLHLI